MGKNGTMLDLTSSEYLAAHYGVAGAGTDNAKQTSPVIDRLNFGSAKLTIPFKAVLAEGKTISFTVSVKHDDASGGSFASELIGIAKTAYATGGSGGSTETGKVTLDIPLMSAKRYLKLEITSDLDAASTDTSVYGANLEMMDPTEAPV